MCDRRNGHKTEGTHVQLDASSWVRFIVGAVGRKRQNDSAATASLSMSEGAAHELGELSRNRESDSERSGRTLFAVSVFDECPRSVMDECQQRPALVI